MLAFVNHVLKALFAAASAFLGVLIGATVAADITWADITLNTWLVAIGAALTAFVAIYFVPNEPAA